MTIHIKKSGFVWTIIHDRFEKARNAMDPNSAQALYEAFLAFDSDTEARAAVLWGKGGAFCSGWDLKFGASLVDSDKQTEFADELAFPIGSNLAPRGPMGPTRLELSKPVIAAVEGPAVAGGMELAMWCDIRIMAETAYMGVYCRRWGVPLLDGGTLRLPRLVGQGKALEIALTGRKVPAEECYQIGLCEKVVPEGNALTAAEAMAREIARFPQGAVIADRRSIIETYGKPIREALRIEWSNGAPCLAEAVAGAARFKEGLGRHGDFENI